MASNARKHHAVALPLPAQGHLNALMRLCKKLASEGFTITFVNVDPVHYRIEELQVDANSTDDQKALDIRRAHLPMHGIDLSGGFRFSFEQFFEAVASLAPQLEKLLQYLITTAKPPITCIISDFFMTTACHELARKFDLPQVVYYPFSASMLLFMSHVLDGKALSQREVVGAIKRKEKGIFHRDLPGLPVINCQDLPTYKHLVDSNEYMYKLTTKNLETCEKESHALVVNSFKEVEEDALKELASNMKVPTYSMGPLVDELQEVETATSLWKEDKACIKWLDQQAPRSVIYISFGSITFFSRVQFEEFVAGLLSSEHHFLFVFRPDLVEQEPCNSIFYPLQLLLSNGKGYVVEWTPQSSILSHPSVGGFLTHCGQNSIMEALFHGVPMLCWPYFADQMMNAKFIVEEWKVGLGFWTNNGSNGFFVTQDIVEETIKALMEGEYGKKIRKNVENFQKVCRQNLSHDGICHRSLQELIKSL